VNENKHINCEPELFRDSTAGSGQGDWKQTGAWDLWGQAAQRGGREEEIAESGFELKKIDKTVD
jgi:hypothetical protein